MSCNGSLFSDDLWFRSLHGVPPCLVDFNDEVGAGLDDGAVGEPDAACILHLTVVDRQLEDSALFSRYDEPETRQHKN